MTRKEFLKNCTAMGMGIPFLSLLLDSCSKEDIILETFDHNFSGKVIVIGAGAAGLTAGYLLDRHNIDFEILEASSVIGGRLKRADNFADFPIDLGAEWVHGDPTIPAQLISDPNVNASIDIITYSPETIYNWNNNKLRKQNWASNFYSDYKFKSTSWFGFFEKYIAAGISDKIVLNSPVKEIDYTDDKVFVKNTNNTIFEADKVLVTVPITILQNGSIDFIPALPSEKIDAINNVDMPDGMKVFMEFSEKFYPDLLFPGPLIKEARSQDKIFYDAAFGKDSNKNILALFTVGERASVYTDLASEDAIINKILGELDEIFDGKASQTYIKHVIQNWSKEPYIQGSYAFEFFESEKATIDTLLQPVENKLYFAGDALSHDNGSTVQGAGETAYDVVERMLVG
ncbi:MAG: FAD-dependent oxidoreductase [Bacteroidetes bacterium]|nr:FAD-dependent oxidoreductase [Bacteroidota bacterium]